MVRPTLKQNSRNKRRRIQQQRAKLEVLEQRVLLAADVSYLSPIHVFSIDDIIGDFAGNTFGNDSDPIPIIDTSATFEDPNNPDPPDYDGPVRAITDRDGNTLYPVDSSFGFFVDGVEGSGDFIGAVPKERDEIYTEGWVGNILDEQSEVIGLSLSDAATDTFKAGLPLGTWAAGLGGNSVKASTEHYVVMQNVLSDQLVPDPVIGPDGLPRGPLDNDLVMIGGDYDGWLIADIIAELTTQLETDPSVDVFPFDGGDGVIDIRDVLVPNEATVIENIAVSDDYSVTLKDDGKLLYRWGTLVKRPNDLRFQAQLDLPAEWLSPEADTLNEGRGFRVTGAELIVTHAITNNPNDQIRPEDWENEAATGRQPSYLVIEDPEHPGDDNFALWVSPVNDFAGDGTFYPSYFKLDSDGNIITTPEPGDELVLDLDGNAVGVRNTDSDGNPVGTILRYVGRPSLTTDILISEGLEDGFTNAWYTTMDRDPFEAVLDENGDYVVGPRWRMKSNKFGQDLPGVEIPLIPHSEPPFTGSNIRYEVGEMTTTTINLLDWEAGEDSPLLYSKGWTTADPTRVNENGVTENGLQLTEKFDIAFYIKGDRKPTRVDDVQLVLNYETDADFDFGDAPSSFPVMLAQDGARHFSTGPTLGLQRDTEIDGLPSALADADTPDEDGVSFGTIRAGEEVTVEVEVGNLPSGTARLDAWIDFDGSGSWEPVEQIADSLEVLAGNNLVTFTVPNDAAIAQSFGRFRLSTEGNLATTGAAADGEVEDWLIPIVPGDAQPDSLAFYNSETGDWQVGLSDSSQLNLSNWATIPPASPWANFLEGDFNGDGFTDIFRWNTTSGAVRILESNGSDAFDDNVWATINPNSAWGNFLVGDFNGDGRDDVFLINTTGGGVRVLQSDGSAFVEALWGSENPNSPFVGHDVGDFNGDGRDDVVRRNAVGGGIRVLNSNGSAFVDELWGSFNLNSPWDDWLIGDFNADGNDDIFRWNTASGGIRVFNSDSTMFFDELWGVLNPNSFWAGFLVGDFDGNGSDDILRRNNSSGGMQLLRESVDGDAFDDEFWGAVNPNINWTAFRVGDFDGDGRDDLARLHPTTYAVQVQRSTISGFAADELWAVLGSNPDLVLLGDYGI